MKLKLDRSQLAGWLKVHEGSYLSQTAYFYALSRVSN